MKKISIIIPVYNALTSGGGYITRAVNSVLNQKNFRIEDIEILLINDGSKDDSLKTLRKIAENNPSIVRLIDQQNMGVAKTRNKAIELAAGEYTTFLDQDDWLDDDFCKTLYDATNGANVVISGYKRPDSAGKVGRIFQPSNTPYGRYMVAAAWAKLHKTTFLQAQKIEFFDNGYGEDIPFMVAENIATDSYKIINYVGYNWFNNEKSVSNTSQKKLTEENVETIAKLFEKLCMQSIQTGKHDFDYYLVRTVVYSLLFSGRNATKQEFLAAKNRLFGLLEAYDGVFASKKLQKFIVAPQGEAKSVSLVITIFILIEKLHLLSIFASVWCKKPKTTVKKAD